MNVTEYNRLAVHETRQTLLERHKGGSWRLLAETLNVHHATLHAIAQGDWTHVSAANFAKVRAALGLPARTGKPAHRPYITSARKWAAYRQWSAEYDAQETP